MTFGWICNRSYFQFQGCRPQLLEGQMTNAKKNCMAGKTSSQKSAGRRLSVSFHSMNCFSKCIRRETNLKIFRIQQLDAMFSKNLPFPPAWSSGTLLWCKPLNRWIASFSGDTDFSEILLLGELPGCCLPERKPFIFQVPNFYDVYSVEANFTMVNHQTYCFKTFQRRVRSKHDLLNSN